MLEVLKQIFGFGTKIDFTKLVSEGAIIIDVRSNTEYKNGHIEVSKNIPLNELISNLGNLDKNKVIITCCASGIRSASAKNIIKSLGFTNVYNGGGWTTLQKKLK